MHASKIHSILAFIASNGDEFKYEIHENLGNSCFYTVIYYLRQIETEIYGKCGVWVQINAHMALDGTNAFNSEEECKKHFLSHHESRIS